MSAATVVDAAGRPARVPVIVQRIALALLLLGAWWLISLAVPPYVLPPPGRVFARIVQLTQSGDLPINLLTTLGRVLAGFALAVALGVPGGILLGSHRALGTFFEPVLPVLNTVSSAIWAIFALIWFGLSPMTPIFVVLMTAFPLIVTNVWQGTQAVNADYVELAQALRFSRCVRSHGVPNFPDPDSTGRIPDPASLGIDQGSPKFQAANQTCRRYRPPYMPSNAAYNAYARTHG